MFVPRVLPRAELLNAFGVQAMDRRQRGNSRALISQLTTEIPIGLPRVTWNVIDIAVALFLVVSILIFKPSQPEGECDSFEVQAMGQGRLMLLLLACLARP